MRGAGEGEGEVTIEQQIDALAAEATAEMCRANDLSWHSLATGDGSMRDEAYSLIASSAKRMRRCWQAERKLREADAMEWVEREDARMGRPIGEQRAKRQQRKAVLAEAEMILKGEV